MVVYQELYTHINVLEVNTLVVYLLNTQATEFSCCFIDIL